MPNSSKSFGKKRKTRLDSLLVERNLTSSRERARAMIIAGNVLVNEKKVEKPGTNVGTDSSIRLLKPDHEYVSRGALKLKGALEHFKIDVKGLTVLDAGASTGGFSDILIRAGAQKIYAVDVGYGILSWKIKSHKNVVSIERTNVRNMDFGIIGESVDLITADLSFISLKKTVPNLLNFLKPGGSILALIKPQFEVGKDEVEKGGLVKDPEKHKRVLREISEFMTQDMKLTPIGTCNSPVRGVKGNREFFVYCKKAK
jgi:23S rRNA (cytidine1920-2'-O)/16S rRNA (cytidine1409-2'-O)-methyltransferase